MNVKQLFDLKDKVAIVTGGKGLYGASISLGQWTSTSHSTATL